jgi:hypothetical protein
MSIAKSDSLPSKRKTEIHSCINILKGLQKDIKYQWIPFHCGVVGNETPDYLAKKEKAASQTFTCNLSFYFAKLKIKRSIQADISTYHTLKSLHKTWNKTVENRRTIPASTMEDSVATF